MTCKSPFPTYEDALAAAKIKTDIGDFATASTPRYNRYRPYLCSNCGAYHLTRNLKTVKKHSQRNAETIAAFKQTILNDKSELNRFLAYLTNWLKPKAPAKLEFSPYQPGIKTDGGFPANYPDLIVECFKSNSDKAYTAATESLRKIYGTTLNQLVKEFNQGAL